MKNGKEAPKAPNRGAWKAAALALSLSFAPQAFGKDIKNVTVLGAYPVIDSGTTENWTAAQEETMRQSIKTTLEKWQSADGTLHLTPAQVAEVMRAVNPVIGTIDDVGRTGKSVTQEGSALVRTDIADGAVFMNNGSNSPEQVNLRLIKEHKQGVRVTVTLKDGTVVEFIVANKCANPIVVTPPRKPLPVPVPTPGRAEVCVPSTPSTEWRIEPRHSDVGIIINGRKLHDYRAVWTQDIENILDKRYIETLGNAPDHLVYVDKDCNGIPEAIYCMYKKDGKWQGGALIVVGGKTFNSLSLEEQASWFNQK